MILINTPFELYDATKSATQNFVYQQRAVRRREDLHESLSAGKDDVTEPHKLQKTYVWPMLAGPIKKDEDELAFEALGAQITVAVDDYKTYVPAVEEMVRYGEPEDDFEVAWSERFASTLGHMDDGSC